MVKDEEKYGFILNKNLASKHKEIHLIMTQYRSKHVVIIININNLCYYFYLNYCVDRYKHTLLNDTKPVATHGD
jgi:hypothetical protein